MHAILFKEIFMLGKRGVTTSVGKSLDVESLLLQQFVPDVK